MRGIGRVVSRRQHHRAIVASSTTINCSSSSMAAYPTAAKAAAAAAAAAAASHTLLSRCLSSAPVPKAAGQAVAGEEGPSSEKGTRAGVRPKGPGFVGRRGESGRGWFQLYQEEGEEGFRRYRPPTPFDWEAAPAEAKGRRIKCFLDVSVDKEPAGRIVIECADEILPVTARNFALLCQGKDANGQPLGPAGAGYGGSGFHKIVKGGGIVGGDLAGGQGPSAAGNHSALGPRFFHDEGFIIPHSAPGLVSMVSAGVHRNGSHFHITTEASPHLDGRAVAFGRVVEGMDVVKKVASTYSIRGRPVAAVKIEKAGVL